MSKPTGRYASCSQAVYHAPDGRAFPYLRRRLVPRLDNDAPGLEVTVGPADRLDMIAARLLGDPLAFWRIADASAAMNPFELVEPGRRLVAPTAGADSAEESR